MVAADKTKELLAVHGKIRPQPPADWKGPFPLPPAIERFYEEVGPANVRIKVPGNAYVLPSLADLWKFQKGYRWNGPTGQPIEDWNDDWIVVADAGGDPFLFDRSSQSVLHAYHGEGEWRAVPLFPDLNTMAACLAEISIIISEARGVHQEDGAVRRDFHRSTAKRLQDLLGPESDAVAILKELGWD